VSEQATWQQDETQGYTNPYDLTPPFVLPWAENILAADSGTALGRSSLKALHDLELVADEYHAGSTRAGEYFMKLRLLANGLASRIALERKLLATREDAARTARDGGFSQAARAKAKAGLRRLGMKLLLFGGFFTSMIYQYMGVNFGADTPKDSWETLISSVIVTTGIGMLGSYGLGFYEEYNHNRHNTKYDLDILDAQRDYQRAVHEHSDNTIRAAAHLWEEFTGQRYDVENELQAQLLLPALRALMGNKNLDTSEVDIEEDKTLHDAVLQARQALRDVAACAKPMACRLLRRK
jgi:hypothetical protein